MLGRHLLAVGSLAVVLVAAAAARADESSVNPNQRVFETQTLVQAGGPVGLLFYSPPDGATTLPFTMMAGQRFRLPRYSPLALELSYVVPAGFGANLLCDVYRSPSGDVRVHLGDLGILGYVRYYPVSVQRAKRYYDITAGLGVDVRVTSEDWLTVNWRVFLPDPNRTIGYYSTDFAGPIYKEAAIGGMLWVGLAHTW